ncbi:hypothetical protein UFOVP1666_135 [uncultured Caudovirales phage]|uniref:Uncharacterized protein n=1 Tax=uncultured Caudovirales phage TaxID=2100421 RepID=A0A6J5PYM4_9CAUD|nr:hypothetical protein UFOVP867_90 [uncultured Caudovirales phage]CAB4170781.1 hypothetical protein UFOVP913_108 [uncultured Caudovirales phage]CAB4177080.1 hypothetical protein UFOVP993_161 [uncultured Caudovirales phage]CAB4223113.1 hypothetical protein UFOVP1666_135 [uncultured Caudovirales phage]
MKSLYIVALGLMLSAPVMASDAVAPAAPVVKKVKPAAPVVKPTAPAAATK